MAACKVYGPRLVGASVRSAAAQCSELLVFDARHLSRGPLASIELPQRVPFGFHGNWVAG